MHRNLPGRVLGGVCVALSLQFGWDPVLIRVLLVVSIVATGALTLWAYALVWFLTPFDVHGKAPATQLFDALGNLFNKQRVPTAQV